MIMDPLLHQQQEMSNTLENMLGCSKENKKAKAQPEHALQCPRCESTNTKFCYYNNYSLSQPRYFCKSCRRYWTKGGTLRNVPVGGGCRKNNKRPSSSPLSKRSQSQDHQQPLNMITSNQNSPYDSNDLTLAFARLQKQHLGFDHHDPTNQGGSFFDALRFGYQNQSPNNFQNLCYGYARNGEVENGSGSYSGEGNGQVLVTTMKQEMCRDQGYDQISQSRSLSGLPWQINGDHHHESINFNNMNHSDVDPARESWSGFAPSWHGLLNSPLM